MNFPSSEFVKKVDQAIATNLSRPLGEFHMIQGKLALR
jgi:hypothetical protein